MPVEGCEEWATRGRGEEGVWGEENGEGWGVWGEGKEGRGEYRNLKPTLKILSTSKVTVAMPVEGWEDWASPSGQREGQGEEWEVAQGGKGRTGWGPPTWGGGGWEGRGGGIGGIL